MKNVISVFYKSINQMFNEMYIKILIFIMYNKHYYMSSETYFYNIANLFKNINIDTPFYKTN